MGSSGGVQFQEPLADNQWSTAFSHVEAIRAKGTTDNREASAVLFVVANNLEGRGSRRGKAAMPASYHCSPSGQVATGLAAGRTLYMATLPYKVIANRQGNFSAALTLLVIFATTSLAPAAMAAAERRESMRRRV